MRSRASWVGSSRSTSTVLLGTAASGDGTRGSFAADPIHRSRRCRVSSAHPPRVQLASVAWDDPDVQRLALAQQAELRVRYDGASEPGVPPSAADLGVVLLARDDAGAV